MQVLPVDIVALIAVIMGVSVVLVPVIGLTARYALKPIVEALGRYFEGQGTQESIKIVERRLGLLESQLDELQGSLNRLVHASEFDAQLRGADSETALPAGTEPGEEQPQPGTRRGA